MVPIFYYNFGIFLNFGFFQFAPYTHGGGGFAQPPAQEGGLGARPWVHRPLRTYPLPRYTLRPPPPSPPPPRGWANQGTTGYPTGAPPAPGLEALGILDASIHAFVAMLQGVVAEGMGADLLSPSLASPLERFTVLLLLHCRFACRVVGYADLTVICEEVASLKGREKGFSTLNQT